jgi:hypothetical protein
MHVEETAHNAVLWARYTDAELAQIHDALLATIPPAEMAVVARWMLPYLNPAERLGMLREAGSKMPQPAFHAMLEGVRPHLATKDWAQLARGLGLPPVPGLAAV